MKTIDRTKMRPSKKLRLIKCPLCGKTGELHKYTDGSANIIHTSHIELGMFDHVDTNCYFKEYTKGR